MQLALEVVRFVDLLVQAVVLEHEQHGALGLFESVVQIDGPDQGFQGIAHHGIVNVFPAHFGLNQVVQPHVLAQQVQVLAVHNAALALGQLAFLCVREHAVEVVGHGHVQHDISQKFKSFIALQTGLVPVQHRRMGQGLVVGASLSHPQAKLSAHQGANVRIGALLGGPSQTLPKPNHERALNTTEALWPPKPKVLLNAARTSRFWALFSVKFSLLSS